MSGTIRPFTGLTARALVVAALGLLGLFASSAPGGVASRSALPARLVGCWRKNVTEADWKRAESPGFPTGLWSIQVKRGGGVVVYAPTSACGGSADFTTSFKLEAGGRLTIAPVPICGSKGSYRWSVSGSRLTVRSIADKACRARIALFAGIWKKH